MKWVIMIVTIYFLKVPILEEQHIHVHVPQQEHRNIHANKYMKDHKFELRRKI